MWNNQVYQTQPWWRGFQNMMSMQYRPGDMYSSQGMNNHQSGTTSMYSNGYPGTNYSMTGSAGGFSFRKRSDRVDWKKIAAADVDHIARDLDFNTLQENIMNITFCHIESELDVGSMDPHFVKLFKLAQLTIEYLLHSQDYLSGMVAAMEEKLKKAIEEHEETQKLMEKQKSELNDVKKESHKRKKMLIAQQQIMNAGVNSYHKCAHCPKAFVNHTFLQSHLQRRHAEVASLTTSQPPVSATTPQPQPEPQPQLAQSQGQISEEQKQLFEKELKELKERLRMTESQLVEERNTRNSNTAKERQEAAKREKHAQDEMDDWKEKQLDAQKKELEKVQNMFMKELKEMNEKYNSAKNALDSMQRKGRSNLGAMEDEMAEERRQLREQREEVAELREQLKEQMADVQSAMQHKFEEQEQKWKEKIKDMNKKHQGELQQLNTTFEKTLDEVQADARGREDLAEEYQKKMEEMQKIVQQSKDQEKKLKQQEKHMDEMAKQVQTPVAAARPPVADRNQVMELPPARPMSPDNEEDDEVSEDEDESSEFGDSTLATTGEMLNGTGTLSFGTGTLKSMSVRLLDQLKKDPNLLQAMKEELSGVLDDKLEQRGIPPSAKGIGNDVLHDKLHALKNERQQMAKKFSNLYDIRQQYIKQIEDMSREQLSKKNRKPAPAASPTKVITSRPAESPKPPRPSSPTRPVSPQRPPTQRNAPKPAPRAMSPQGKLLSTMSTMSSTGTYGTTTGSQSTWGTTTATSESQWDSDADSDGPITARSDRNTSSPKKVQSSMSPRSLDDDSDWDDGSELQELQEIVTRSPAKEPMRIVSYSPQPRGENVAKLTATIESQLGARGKKPAGGVEIVGSDSKVAKLKKNWELSDRSSHQNLALLMSNCGTGSVASSTIDDSWDDDDDDDFSVSSLDETASAPPSRNASFKGKQNTPSDLSTGTSQWGGSSKDKPQPSPRRSAVHSASTPVRGASISKGSILSVSDFDDESDLSIDDL